MVHHIQLERPGIKPRHLNLSVNDSIEIPDAIISLMFVKYETLIEEIFGMEYLSLEYYSHFILLGRLSQ